MRLRADNVGRLPPPRAAASRSRRPPPTGTAEAAHGRRRIEAFSRNFYRYGLLGTFIGSGHLLGPALRLRSGRHPRGALASRSRGPSSRRRSRPIFDKGFALWLSRQPASLFGLGIPPAQYRKLAADRPGGIAAVLRHRLERLACDFDVSQNYFAWQAFGRRYATTSVTTRFRRTCNDATTSRSERPRRPGRRFTRSAMTTFLARRNPRQVSIAWCCSMRKTG